MQIFRQAGFGLAALASLSLMGGAHAGGIDQSQTSQAVDMANFNQTDLAQSFQQTHNNITGASIFLFNTVETGSGDVTISLYDALPNASGNLLASGTALGVAPGGEATVNFAQTAVTPGQTYFLVFTDTNLNQGIAGDINNPYPHGEVFANSGYGAFPNFDYAFQTYYGDAPVPEASTTVSFGLLLTLGLGGIVLAARKRKAASAE